MTEPIQTVRLDPEFLALLMELVEQALMTGRPVLVVADYEPEQR